MSTFFRDKPVFARVDFTYAGQEYKAGDAFTAPAHKIQQMWFARKLTHVGVERVVEPLVTLENTSGSWYNVLMSGAVMNPEKIKTKQAAIEWAIANLGVTKNDIGV